MTPGDIVLVHMPTRKGTGKKRPALVLMVTEPFGDLVVCGISSQTRNEVPEFDIILNKQEEGFQQTGLKQDSLFRLGYITTVAKHFVPGKIGQLPEAIFSEVVKRIKGKLQEGTARPV